MLNEFRKWLDDNGLKEEFTTLYGDSFYTNRAKQFGVLRQKDVFEVKSFYLDDIIEIKAYDDENLVAEWNCISALRFSQRNTHHSTNEMYVKIRLRDQSVLKIQIFKAAGQNIQRHSDNHVRLYNYICQISRLLHNCAMGN